MPAEPELSEQDLVTSLRAAGCVFAEDEARILLESARSQAELIALVARRVAGEPLEHVVGWVDFASARVSLDAGVFIPRQRTRFLVDRAAALVRPGGVVLDLCCGSGAIALALAHWADPAEVHAADLDPVAVACAQRNLDAVGGHAYCGDLFTALPEHLRGRIDVLTANVPYVPTAALDRMPAEARENEPQATHDGGTDGLDVLRRVLAEVGDWLAPGGRLLVEVYRLQIEQTRLEFERAGLAVDVTSSPEHYATVATGTAPGR